MRMNFSGFRANRRGSFRGGFTMIELLTVISIIVVLLSLSFFGGRIALIRAKENKARAQVKLLGLVLQDYEADQGFFPPGNGDKQSSNQLYQALYATPLQDGTTVYADLDPNSSQQFSGQIVNRDILDPFRKNPYFYLRGEDESGEVVQDAFNVDFDLWSVGHNGVGRGVGGTSEDDIADDIGNW